MKGFNASRAELFATTRQARVERALPDEPYAFAVWKRCRVAPDYHVEVDGHWYSAPFRLIRELVDVRVADKTVEIFPQRAARRQPYARAQPSRPHDASRAHAQRASPPRLMDASAPDRLRRKSRPLCRRAVRGGHDRPAPSRTGLSNLPGNPRPDPDLRQCPRGRRLPARRPDQGALGRLHPIDPEERPRPRLPRRGGQAAIANPCATATSVAATTTTNQKGTPDACPPHA